MPEEEIEFALQRIKKIVVLECTEFPLEEFFQRVGLMVRAAAAAGQPTILNWAEGIAFLHVPYQRVSERIIDDLIERGTMYFSMVIFASMPEYQPIKKFGALELTIIDQSSVSYLRQLATWLKKQSKA